MADALLSRLRLELPETQVNELEAYISKLETGDYEGLLRSPQARTLFGLASETNVSISRYDDRSSWTDFIARNIQHQISNGSNAWAQYIFFCIGYASLLAFLQSNVTGPPLPFSSATLLFPEEIATNPSRLRGVRQGVIAELSHDGVAAYKLTPNVELLCLADTIFTCPAIQKHVAVARWAKCRTTFLHQRLLSEVSSTLQNTLYDHLGPVADDILMPENGTSQDRTMQVEFLLERATIHIHHGLDKFAREDLDQAKSLQRFEYALTGLLGKRTKFQEKETSQLVVLAKSNAETADSMKTDHKIVKESTDAEGKAHQPDDLNLNDDTLLESISFSKRENPELELPAALADLDPSDQPKLDPLDSTILLSFASSIKNINPEDGLTREETLPYATRVVDGGSSNWQIYTQALLVRSRIEGYRSRTIERGLLQLQALVDQVIADTYSPDASGANSTTATNATSFLPRPKEFESAPVSQRLRYIFQLASPTRWDLEAELASRWVSLGGLRSALEIYERLEMWAEAALCWAATEREDKARSIIRRQLYEAGNEAGNEAPEPDNEDEKWDGPERDPRPLDAPRLYCILGDIDKSPEMYEKAWLVSGNRYARAQRSLGRLYLASQDYVRAADAYSKSLKANQLNHSSWFALGCCLLELSQFERAVEAFSRCIQLDESDGESWSNLAAALLRCEPKSDDQASSHPRIFDDDDDDDQNTFTQPRASPNPQKNRIDALKALQRAAALKRESYRIWQNMLVVAASLSPPDYPSILTAQTRIIDLRGATEGEKCLDIEILSAMINHVIASSEVYDASKPGFTRLLVRFIDEKVIPLITASPELWRLVGRLALWRGKPGAALDAEEKAWRVVIAQPGWETESEEKWNVVVDATMELCDAYENLGMKQRTEGLGGGEGVLVAKDWKFKSRSAIRGIMGRGKASWEGTGGWEKLEERIQSLRK